MDIEELEYQKSNREKRQGPKAGLSYCPACDRNLVADGEKCDVCGVRLCSGHRKKRRFKFKRGENV